jgi:hypothetical protein
MSAEVIVSEIQSDEKKVVFAMSLPGHACRDAAFGTDRCCYVGRDTALWKYPVNSRSKISKWKLLNYIQSIEAISTLKQKNISHVHNISTQRNQKSKLLWTKYSTSSSASCCFPLAVTLSQSKHLSLYGEQNSCSQFMQFTHSIQSSSLVVSQHAQHFVSESSDVSWLWISF